MKYMYNHFLPKIVIDIEIIDNMFKRGITGARPELVDSRLVRSMESWSKGLAFRGRDGKRGSDERILGDNEFVQRRQNEEGPSQNAAS